MAQQQMEKLAQEKEKQIVDNDFKDKFHTPPKAEGGETQKRAREQLMQRKEAAQKRRMVAMAKATLANPELAAEAEIAEEPLAAASSGLVAAAPEAAAPSGKGEVKGPPNKGKGKGALAKAKGKDKGEDKAEA